MTDKATTKATSTAREIPPSTPTSTSSQTSPQRRGEAIMKSIDPSTAALREWALDKETQGPGANGSIAVNSQSVDAMGFAGAHILPRKGDTLLPPDEKHGEAEYVGGAEEGAVGKGELEGGKRRRSSRLSGLFHRKEKGYKEGKGEEGDVVQ